MIGTNQKEQQKKKTGDRRTVASTEGQTQRPHASVGFGGLYIPFYDPHTPLTPGPNPTLGPPVLFRVCIK